LYFTTENFTVDDKYFFFNRQTGDGPLPDGGLYKCDVKTGEAELMAGSEYRGFAMDRFENYGVLCRGHIVCRLDCDTGKITELGSLPEGGNVTGHLTTSRSGRIACTSELKPKWLLSFKAPIAPRNTTQTNKKRENSSAQVMPELNT
jgi:oligogalacturonide lyase